MPFNCLRILRNRALACCLLLLTATGALADSNSDKPRATLHTSKGDIVIELYPDKAPVTVENFLQYARDGFYDGTIFHRVIRRFVIQGGGFTEQMQEKPTRAPIVNESSFALRNERWTVAMARTNDPDSATSQFYINVGINLSLDYKPRKPGYAVFGKVVEGQNVVADISKVKTAVIAGMADVPVEPIKVLSVSITPASETTP